MTCHEVLEQVEAIAAGDVTTSDATRHHLESCPSCAAALATARRIEGLLAARPVVEAPPRFVSVVQQRIRRERWQLEERVDSIFNVGIAAAAVLFVAGLLFVLRASAVFEAAGQLSSLLTTVGSEAVQAAAPTLATYVAATGLFLSGLAMWWWAES
jgi:anti-sigma factor RsiW